MDVFIVLPTQLFSRPKSFWKQWKRVVVFEDPHHINKRMHPLKLWMHRASMMEYFDTIGHNSKTYVKFDQPLVLNFKYTMCHPTDEALVRKYKKATIIDSPGFLLKIDELRDMHTPAHDVFYKKMRTKLNILMNKDKPTGDKWSFDESNRQRYPLNYTETNPLDRSFKNKWISKSRPIVDLSVHKFSVDRMMYPTNRKTALADLKRFVQERLKLFGPYQDAINSNVLVGYHSCISAPLNIGLITPSDVIKEIIPAKVPIESKEALVRQCIGWREYIRMHYVLHGPRDWSYLKHMDTHMDKSWYNATTGIRTLDWSIKRMIDYAYAPHIERLMLQANYAVLLRLRYDDVLTWFKTMSIDGYDWVMLNVSMGVNGLSPDGRFMKRAYLTNGTYLKKMGLDVPKEDTDQLKQLYNRFVIDNKALTKKDYRLAAIVKRCCDLQKKGNL